jgi:hypothetical protein
MSQAAHYSVIRYIPDPGRGERLNVGILVWDERQYQLSVDDDAVKRVIRENPLLEQESLLYVQPMLLEALAETGGPAPAAVEELLSAQRGFPVELSEPRMTTVANASPGALHATLARLNDRIVRPKRRTSGGANPLQRLDRKLKPLVTRGAVARNHFFSASRTGVPRNVDFFANSRVNTALDVVALDIKKADDIRKRADAEAFKVYDIVERNAVRYVVYCVFSDDSRLRETNHNARQVIESIGAEVVTGLDEATRVMQPR